MKVEMIIPNQDNDGTDNALVIESTISQLCSMYGGCTAYAANGYWVNNAGRLFKDEVTVLVSAALENSKADELRAIARKALKHTDQEAIFISIGDKAEIIE